MASNPLSGQHLRILATEFLTSLKTIRNATDHVIHAEGILTHLLAALSDMRNFSYSYVPVDFNSFEDTPTRRGAISYLMNNDADFMLSTMVPTPSRFTRLDFPSSWYFGPFSTLLPYPHETPSLIASFKPLSYEVWVVVVITVFTTMLFLKLLLRWNSFRGDDSTGGNDKGVVLYVLGNLVSQGQSFISKRLATRIAAGAWCCGCFFLVQIYCCTLTSHLTSPNQKPLINSFFQIADTHGVILTIERGFAIDLMLQSVETEHIKRFMSILKKENRIITCKIPTGCLEYIKRGNVVYPSPPNALNKIMYEDLKSTGTCHYTRTRETFWSMPVFTVLRKNSPYTEVMSRGILRMRETGLLAEWEKWYVPSPTKCMKLNEQHDKPRLSLKHLSSPFLILITGYVVSLTVFVLEIFVRKLACLFWFFGIYLEF